MLTSLEQHFAKHYSKYLTGKKAYKRYPVSVPISTVIPLLFAFRPELFSAFVADQAAIFAVPFRRCDEPALVDKVAYRLALLSIQTQSVKHVVHAIILSGVLVT